MLSQTDNTGIFEFVYKGGFDGFYSVMRKTVRAYAQRKAINLTEDDFQDHLDSAVEGACKSLSSKRIAQLWAAKKAVDVLEASLEKGEKSEKSRKFVRSLHYSIKEGIRKYVGKAAYNRMVYDRRRRNDRRDIVEVEADSGKIDAHAVSLSPCMGVDPWDYVETGEERIALKAVLDGNDTKQIAETLCLTQKQTATLLDGITSRIAEDLDKDQRRQTRELAYDQQNRNRLGQD